MIEEDSNPKPKPNPVAGRFFVNTLWRSPESNVTEEGKGTTDSELASVSQRQGFGTFDSSPSKKPSIAVTNNEILSLQSLYISDVPDHLMDKTIMMKHFSQYGKLTRVSLSMKRKSCTLHFENHEMAEKAKANGSMLGNNILNIFWSQASNKPRTQQKLSSDTNVFKAQREESVKPRDKHDRETGSDAFRAVTKDTEHTPVDQRLPVIHVPDEVREELESMALSLYRPPERPVSQRKPVKKSLSKEPGNKQIMKKRVSLGNKPASSNTSRAKVAASATTDTEAMYGSTASMEDLQKIMRVPAHTAEERYRVLEARDKLMRMKRIRQSDLTKARKNRGTCPDMCPEKERYHREYQRQVALYEQLLPGRMDMSKAVKEYSRSSADQEEPLSHELRPAHVLRMTMDFLMWNLMDLCNKKDENLGDWYHYIWDRTRGIRKDITQQDLCDENAVTLVEQCARFHIFCSERMIAEDLSIYDDKINTENLTKCLQTLKYMYHDLSLKGTPCPNEAEFRAYFVLLNLNEGDCMWEVQQLTVEVRQSEPVRFALQVSAALSSNNYIRFFKLVRSSTYLNACILHRYFAQVRSQALSTILKAYCLRVDTVFSLEEVVRLTGFENIQEAALLCSHHGFQLTPDGSSVIFSRSSYCQPDTFLTTTRNHSLIGAKCSGSVAEVVSGGLPPQLGFQSHLPHESFGSDGILVAEAWKALDQQLKVQFSTSEDGLLASESDASSIGMKQEIALGRGEEPVDSEAQKNRALMQLSLEKQCQKTAKEIISQVVEDEVCSIVEQCVKDAHIEHTTKKLYDEVLAHVTSDLIREVCEEVVTAEVCLEKERERAKQLALEADMRNKLIENKAAQELNFALDLAIREICKGVIEEELLCEKVGIQWCEEILREVVREECVKSVKEAIAEARTVKLEAILSRIQSRRLRYFFHKWQCLVNRSKMMQESMISFPAWMSNMSLDEQVSGLEQPDPCYIQRLTEKHHLRGKIKPVDLDCELPSLPVVDFGKAITHHYVKRMKELSYYDVNSFWKVVVSLPDVEEAPTVSDTAKRWTDSVFSLDDKSTLLIQTKPNAYETLTICMRCITGPITDVDACGGVNGVFFWISHKEKLSRAVCRRLLAVLSAKPSRPAIPVAFVWTGPAIVDNEEIIKELALEKLQESNIVSHYKFFPRKSNTRRGLASQMECASQWLAQNAPCLPPLFVTSMRQLVNQCLTHELWERIRGNMGDQNPNRLVDLYNTAIQKLQEYLCDPGLKQYSLGAAEFHKFIRDDHMYREQYRYQIAPDYWGSQQYFSTIEKFLSDAQLATVPSWPPLSSHELNKTLSDYCTSQGLPHITSDLYRILEQQRFTRLRASFPPYTSSNWKLFLKTLPWSHVLQAVAEAKLESLDCGFVSRNVSSKDGLLVVLHQQSLKQFRCFPWWSALETVRQDRADPNFEVDKRKEMVGQKRPLVNEAEVPRKRQRLSLSDALAEIKAMVLKIDSTMTCAKITREKILATYDLN